MAATLHDVALLAKVSIKTVSNVVNGYPYIKDSTKTRVLEAIAALGYQPNLTARGLRLGRTGVIGLAVPELRLSYFAELADAVIRAADRHGIGVQIEQTNGDRDRELALITSARRQLTDGLIFSPLGLGNEDAALLAVGYPLVLLGERIFDAPADHVTMRNVEAAAAATRRLLAAGRTRIAVIGAHEGEVYGSAALRIRGYRDALQAAGLPVDPALIRHSDMWHRANGATSVRGLLETGVPFDAVFGLNDTLALGAIRALQAAGVRVPEDVSVVGFDNLDESEYSHPSLSTIDAGRDEIADTAVRLLLERIAETGPKAPTRRVEADFRLVERESIGPDRNAHHPHNRQDQPA
jgi:DNA-binding LacI/PurR family transcriptional regulator